MSAEKIPVDSDYPYDWDQHFEMAWQLAALDRIDLEVSRQQIEPETLQTLVLNGPYDPDGLIRNSDEIDGNVIAAYVPTRLKNLKGLFYQQIILIGIRAECVARSTEHLLHVFSEEEYRPGLFRLTESADTQLADLAERLKALNTVVDATSQDLGQSMIRSHQHLVKTLRSVFRDTAGFSDPLPVAERLPVLKSTYQHMALLSLRHAEIEKNIAEECLSLTATDIVLRDVFNAQNDMSCAPFQNLASFSLLTAMMDLDYAATLRNGINWMEEARRPFFVAGSFLSAPSCH